MRGCGHGAIDPEEDPQGSVPARPREEPEQGLVRQGAPAAREEPGPKESLRGAQGRSDFGGDQRGPAQVQHRARSCRGEEGSDKYGRRAVTTLGILLGYDKSTLNDYAAVATAWGWGQLKSMLGRKNPAGLSLTFSHFIELAGVTDEDEVQRVLTEAVEEGFSVAQLRQRLRGHRRVARARCGRRAEGSQGHPAGRCPWAATSTR